MKRIRIHNTDYLYAIIWIVVALLYVLDIVRGRASADSSPVLDTHILARTCAVLAPFFLLFLYNNYLLIPRYLLPGRTRAYLIGAIMGLAAIVAYQYTQFASFEAAHRLDFPAGADIARFQPPQRLFPLPLLLDFIYDILVIGSNIAISLGFQRYDDSLDRERLLKATAQSELSYLRAQINPHFYMNMLNNIHGMIEIDAEGAQEMVMDMSHLMRYMLYDSSRPTTTLDKEVAFIRTYLNIMRRRFPPRRVEISASLPEGESLRHIELPPLLFLVFIENAFKHGISYLHESFVAISMDITGKSLNFSVMNSRFSESDAVNSSGIGLANIRQRLGLIYGDRASLKISESPHTYTVQLSVPINETSDNRY